MEVTWILEDIKQNFVSISLKKEYAILLALSSVSKDNEGDCCLVRKMSPLLLAHYIEINKVYYIFY